MGVGYWSQSPCRSDVWWWRDERGVWYWIAGRMFLVWGSFLDTYAANGYECGWLGAVTSDRFYDARNGLERQNFENGYIYRYVA